MWTWLSENWGSLAVGLALAGAAAAIIRGLIRDRKQGKSSCGAGCASCPMAGSCRRRPG